LLKSKKIRLKKKENISNVEFVLCSGELMDKTWEKKFDWITMVDVLHDLPNPDPLSNFIFHSPSHTVSYGWFSRHDTW
jgi:2-polyprenyl-3-methyl-5-hydroxy-6-metoxy-1,4-benzoquinol methylase